MEKAIYDLANRSHHIIPVREGDFVKDGLWHCGICKTPKQYKKEMDGFTINAMCLCKCEAEKLRKEEEEERRKREAEEKKRQRLLCFPSPELSKCTFANSDTVNKVAENYVSHFAKALEDGTGLLFYGGVGTGKTYMAAAIANALIDEGRTVRFNTARGYADQFFSDKNVMIEALRTCNCVILDDLNAERQTDYMQETVFQIVNIRYEMQLPIIVTTNLSPAQFSNPSNLSEERIFSRLTRCFPVLISGEDRRKKQARSSEWKEVLYG